MSEWVVLRLTQNQWAVYRGERVWGVVVNVYEPVQWRDHSQERCYETKYT